MADPEPTSVPHRAVRYERTARAPGKCPHPSTREPTTMRQALSRLSARGAALAAALAALLVTALPVPQAQAFPATPKANVLTYLQSVTGNHVVSGQHNKEPASAPAQYTQQVKNITGQYPGLWGGDLMFNPSDVANRQSVVNQAKTEWANGSLVALTWHVCPPTQGSGCAFDGGVKSSITNDQFTQIVTEGTALNTAWKKRLDEAVPYFQQLKDAGIPVLFRPLHEMNETWNWWGNRPGANGGAKLYQITHDYLANTKGLSNLIWVWNVQDNPAGGWATYYPGSAYVDVVSLDAWYKSYPSAADYQQLLAIAGAKPIAIAELGKIPTAALLDSQPKWAYFMLWSEQLTGNNTNAEIQTGYFLPRVVNQGEITLPTGGTGGTGGGTGAITGLGGKCVDARAAGTANGTAVQLYTCASGTAQTWTVAADGTIRNPNSGRCLDITAAGTANGSKVQLYDCNGTTAQQWQAQASGQLKNPQSGRCLDVPGGSTADGTQLQIWDCNTNAWQKWTLPG
ncbi:glycosyl hydrolase [Kitasatospora indigofera]|uniref:glycosyl hydrolase n=1 Tax=Kitasatospora indigofera TaxID=67307 RepID=UPI0033BBCBA2